MLRFDEFENYTAINKGQQKFQGINCITLKLILGIKNGIFTNKTALSIVCCSQSKVFVFHSVIFIPQMPYSYLTHAVLL